MESRRPLENRALLRLWTSAACILASAPLPAQVIINEVLASNRLTLADDDGDHPDWVELFNPGDSEVALHGLRLSDEAGVPSKFVFPDLFLAPRSHLTVWCSGKDRVGVPPEKLTQPDSPLPFEPAFVGLEAEWRYLTGLPADAGPPPSWKDPDFDDTAWLAGKPGFGFGDGDDTTVLPSGIGAVFLRHRFRVSGDRKPPNLVLQLKLDDGFIAYLNGVRVAEANAPADEPTFATVATRTVEARSVLRHDLTSSLQHLRSGDNVLAIALLNRSATDSDLTLLPELGIVPPILHASFELDAGGERLYLTAEDGSTVDSVALPEQFEDQSYGRDPAGSGAFVYLLNPTPGAPNVEPSSPEPLVVRDTVFSRDRGFYTAPFTVEISTATAGAQIRYTLDGAAPTAATGEVYSGPLSIAGTTTLRAAAFKEGMKATNVDTHTYIFLEDIVLQDAKATVARGFPASWGTTTPDYGMDPEVIGGTGPDRYGGKYAATIRDDLQAVPTISLVLRIDDLFGQRGIYSNSEQRGVAWERPVSAELIDPAGGEGFQVDAGLRIHGGAFRSHGLTKKHSLRLIFKGAYGPTKLRFPLFGYAGAADSFDTLVLRVNSNDGWQWDAAGARPLYIRDSFGRETALALGTAASHERFFHVYLNGAYWGLYNCVERPDASFCATYFGGDKEEWDAVSNDAPSNGTLAAWTRLAALLRAGLGTAAAYQAIQGNAPDGSDDPLLESYLDVPNVIDYMIVNLYVGNTDWPHKNWWVGRRTIESTGFKYFLWDSEWSMGIQSDLATNQTNVSTGVAAAYAAARANPEFRMLFADHLHRAFFHGGPLYVDPANGAWDPAHPERNVPAARFQALADKVDRAIVAESARWGDQHAARPYTRDEHWQVERDNLLRSYFPQRSRNVLTQFRQARLYPALEAPTFSQHGGHVPEGFGLLIRGRKGEIHYTLDGSDPRLAGGDVSPTALQLEPPETRLLVSAGATARFLVPADGGLGLDWTQPGFDDSAWSEGPTGIGFETQTGLESEIQTDVRDRMHEQSAGIYLRLAFDLEEPAASSFLTLRVKYDDGYVAYVNGVRVAAQNAPATAEWSSVASRSHTDAQAVLFEDADLTGHIGLLRRGRNVLAMHGLNLRATDADFLILPQLEESRPRAGPIAIARTTRVKSRALDAGEWSALNEATFVVEGSMPLRITEIMYHPPDPPDGSDHAADDFEFVEVQNVGSRPVNLDGVRLEGGIRLDFTGRAPHELAPGEIVLAVKDFDAFRERHDTRGLKIAGEYAGRLDNKTDTVRLTGAHGETLLEVTYRDDWHETTDGGGWSLVLADPATRPEDMSLAASWRPSRMEGGSPGFAETALPGGGLQLPSDLDQDGRRNITDAVTLLLRLFGGLGAALPCEGSIATGGNLALHDASGDGRVDLADAVHMLEYLFRAGPPPALGPACVRIAGCPEGCR
jgi:hypothetical protein